MKVAVDDVRTQKSSLPPEEEHKAGTRRLRLELYPFLESADISKKRMVGKIGISGKTQAKEGTTPTKHR